MNIKSWLADVLQLKLVRYGLIGGVSTAIHLVFAFLLIGVFASTVFWANVVGFLCAYGVSYLAQASFVFESSVSLGSALRYFGVQLAALLVSLQISQLFGQENAYLRTVLVVLVIPLITFVIHKMWTFSSHTVKA